MESKQSVEESDSLSEAHQGQEKGKGVHIFTPAVLFRLNVSGPLPSVVWSDVDSKCA